MKIQVIIAIIAIFVWASCDNLSLNESPRSALNPVQFYEDEPGLNAGLNAAYANLRWYYGQGEAAFRMTILGTDLWTHGKAEVGLPFVHYGPDLDSFLGEVEDIWSTSYEIINITNTVINSAPDVDMNENEKEQIIAQARFIRGLSYFWLVQQFGDVPITLDPTLGVERDATREPMSEVYQVILDDLIFAETHLESSFSDWGRSRKGAAQHLLSKVYLVLEEWENAAELAIEVINSPEYELLDNFADIFHHDNQINSEIIFSVQYSENEQFSGNLGNRTHLFFQNSYSDINGLERVLMWGRPWTRFAPTDFMMSLFDNDLDERTDMWRTFDDYYYNDEDTLPDGKEVGDPVDEIHRGTIEFHTMLTKYHDPTRLNANATRGNKDFIVFRLGETYLIAAEALMRSGQTSEALTYFNKLRNRASRPGEDFSITASDLDINMILDERARELAGEMHRWNDLVRTDTALDRIRTHLPTGQGIQEFHLLRPIPQNQIDRVNVPFEQNPGY